MLIFVLLNYLYACIVFSNLETRIAEESALKKVSINMFVVERV